MVGTSMIQAQWPSYLFLLACNHRHPFRPYYHNMRIFRAKTIAALPSLHSYPDGLARESRYYPRSPLRVQAKCYKAA